jgi:hypothetical protein
MEIIRQMCVDIRNNEDKYHTYNTIIIGDFNSNPFEPACISGSALHAIPFAKETVKNTRVIQGTEYRKFYNPCWKFYGKRDVPYTTYYYDNNDMNNYYWNVFDQVIIRPQLINAFKDESLTIISGIKNHELLKSNKPDKNNYSDHLPLFCSIEEGKILE